MTNRKSLEAFIKAIENYSCKDVKLKHLKSITQVLEEFNEVKKFGSEYELHYVLDFLSRESIVMFKEYIYREGDIRFLKVDVKVGSEL